MSNDTLLKDETTVSNEIIEVTRRLRQKGDGIVGVLELRSTGPKPVVMVHVVDEFPFDLPVEAVGYNSEAEPEAGSITPQGASIRQTVRDEPIEVQYGIKLSEPVDDLAFDPPTIRAVETAELTRSVPSLTDGGRGASRNADDPDDSSGSFSSSIISLLGRGPSRTEGEDDPVSPDPGPSETASGRPKADGWGLADESDDTASESVDGDAEDGANASDEAIKSAIARIDQSDDTEEEPATVADSESMDDSESLSEDGPMVDEEPEDETVSAESIKDAELSDELEAAEGSSDPEHEPVEADDGSDAPGSADTEEADVDEATAESEAESASSQTVEPEAEAQAAAEAGSESDADAEAEAVDDAEAGTDAEVEVEGEPESQPDAEVESASEEGGPGDDDDGGSLSPERRSVEARLDQLTLRVETFGAYAKALEELIDEHGPASEFLDRTRRELADLDERLQSVREEVESVQGDHGEELEDLRERTDALDRRFLNAQNRFEGEVGDVRERVEHVDDEVGRVDETVERIDADLAEQGSDVRRIDDDVEGLTDRVDGLETNIQSVRETVRTVEDDVSTVSEDVRAMREEVESLRAAVESFNDVRKTLASAFDLPTEEAPADD